MAKIDWQMGDAVQPEDMNQIGQEINELRQHVDNIEVPPASTEQAGIVQLSNAVNSLSESLAATPKAVKTAYDRAEQAFQHGNERKEEVVDALIAVGVSASISESWDSLITKIAAVIRATGNADRSEVLTGRTFSNASANGLTGTMPNRGAVAPTLTSQGQQYTVPQGYHNGLGKVTANITNLNAGNVRSGATVGGVAGTFSQFTNGAAANQILQGRSAAVNGSVVNGTMPNLGGNQPAQAVRARNNTLLGLRPQHGGFYPAGTGNWLEYNEPNWKPENIVEGVSMFGKTGTAKEMPHVLGFPHLETDYKEDPFYGGGFDGENLYAIQQTFNNSGRIRKFDLNGTVLVSINVGSSLGASYIARSYNQYGVVVFNQNDRSSFHVYDESLTLIRSVSLPNLASDNTSSELMASPYNGTHLCYLYSGGWGQVNLSGTLTNSNSMASGRVMTGTVTPRGTILLGFYMSGGVGWPEYYFKRGSNSRENIPFTYRQPYVRMSSLALSYFL